MCCALFYDLRLRKYRENKAHSINGLCIFLQLLYTFSNFKAQYSEKTPRDELFLIILKNSRDLGLVIRIKYIL